MAVDDSQCGPAAAITSLLLGSGKAEGGYKDVRRLSASMRPLLFGSGKAITTHAFAASVQLQ